jgi:AP-1-like transcription factor
VQQVQTQQAQLQAAQPISLQDGLPLTKEETDDHANRQGSNSDDEDLTPAQSRRKAQNRAA